MICVTFLTVQIDVFSKGMGKYIFTEWTSQERCDTESLLRAERISHVARLCCTWNEEEGL